MADDELPAQVRENRKYWDDRAHQWTAAGERGSILSAIGLYAGRQFGMLLGKRLDAFGGVLLIGLGTKILIEHLSSPA